VNRLPVLVVAIAAAAPGAVWPQQTVDAEAQLGAYSGAGCDGAKAIIGFESYLGRRVDRVVDFIDFRTWKDFDSSSRWLVQCWYRQGRPLVLSVPMLTKEPAQSLQSGAEGEYDAHFIRLAQLLATTGQPDAILRIGWEFNGDWYPWAAHRNPAAFVSYWRRIAGLLRATPGQRFVLDWNPTLGKQKIAPDAVYPGDDVVDVIGLDVYNQSWTLGRLAPSDRWRELLTTPYGINWHRSFAQERGKRVSFPEWGTGDRRDGKGGGDDRYFVEQMATVIRSPVVLYHGYWDFRAPDYDAKLSDGRRPQAAAAFRARFALSR
jgi:hypothetical protein